MSHRCYLITSLGAPRDHHAIFVETNDDHSGHVFQVTGNIQSGMAFEHKKTQKLEDSPEFISKSPTGTVSKVDLTRIEPMLLTLPAPPKQFDGLKRMDPSKPIQRCQEWTSETIQKLKNEGILQS